MSFQFGDAAQLLTAEEVARILRIKPATVYEAASDGRIPCVRLWRGTRRDLVRFRWGDIERLIHDRGAAVPPRPDEATTGGADDE